MIKISDEDIMSFVKESLEKEVKQRGLIKEVEEEGAKQDSQCEDLRNYPSFNITKVWGNLSRSNVPAAKVKEAELVRSIFDQAFAGTQRYPAGSKQGKLSIGGRFRGKSFKDKIAAINDLSTVPIENINPANGLAYIVAMDNLLALKSSLFQTQSQGYLNEAFMAALLSGFVETNKLEDIRISGPDEDTSTPFSLKLVNRTSARRLSNSFSYFKKFFDSGQNQITYIVAVKPDDRSLPEIRFYSIVIDKPNGWDDAETDIDKVKTFMADTKYNFLKFEWKDEKKEKVQSIKQDTEPSQLAGLATENTEQVQIPEGKIPSRIFFSAFDETAAENFATIKLPDEKGMREKAQAVLAKYNKYLSDIYGDLEHIRCYTNNYLAGNKGFAGEALKRSARLSDNIKQVFGEDK